MSLFLHQSTININPRRFLTSNSHFAENWSWMPRRFFIACGLLATTILLSGCLRAMPLLAPSAKNVEENISDRFSYASNYVDVLGSKMHYIDEGKGPVVILLHGNPTSSYLWRNVVPQIADRYRVIAPDLIGMGKSDKPDIAYRFDDHTRYFSAFVEALELNNVALVLHDWGGAIGIDYAASHPDDVRAIAVMEAVIKPMSWAMADLPTRYLFGRLRDPEENHEIIAIKNYFVEKMLPMLSGRELSREEMTNYAAPYPTVESRKPVAQWPLEIPFEDGPEDNAHRIGKNFRWLAQANTPMLALHASPGAIFTSDFMDMLIADVPRIQTIHIGSGMHYLQEVQPTLIGTSVAQWLSGIDNL